MQDAVNEIRAVATNVKITIASPRVLKPGEAGIWRTLLRLEPDGLLVRSSGLLYRLTELGGAGARVNVRTREGGDCWVRIPELFGDFSLNVANPLTAYEYLNSGLSRITTSVRTIEKYMIMLSRCCPSHQSSCSLLGIVPQV